MIRALRNRPAWQSGSLVAKFLRFGVVGAATGLIYGVVVYACVRGFGMSPGWAGATGYCASIPLNFIGHRHFAFRAKGDASRQLLRYGVSTAIGIGASSLIMHFSVGAGLGVVAGIAATILTIPVITFVALNTWVFRSDRRAHRSPDPIGHS